MYRSDNSFYMCSCTYCTAIKTVYISCKACTVVLFSLRRIRDYLSIFCLLQHKLSFKLGYNIIVSLKTLTLVMIRLTFSSIHAWSIILKFVIYFYNSICVF